MKFRLDRAVFPLFAAVLTGSPAVFGDEWEEVQRILAGTREIVVLDGVETAPGALHGNGGAGVRRLAGAPLLVRSGKLQPVHLERCGRFQRSGLHLRIAAGPAAGTAIRACRTDSGKLPGSRRRSPEVHLRYPRGGPFLRRKTADRRGRPLQHEGDPASGGACPPSAQLLQLRKRRPYRRGIPRLFLLQGTVLPQRPDAWGVQHHPEALLRS